MIIDKEVKPNKNLYYLGSQILKILRAHQFGIIPIDELYAEILKKRKSYISFDYLMLALDWLFILELVDTNEDGEIRKCF
jgi:hypothetical protein